MNTTLHYRSILIFKQLFYNIPEYFFTRLIIYCCWISNHTCQYEVTYFWFFQRQTTLPQSTRMAMWRTQTLPDWRDHCLYLSYRKASQCCRLLMFSATQSLTTHQICFPAETKGRTIIQQGTQSWTMNLPLLNYLPLNPAWLLIRTPAAAQA